ncbi:hypothetical protein BG015_008265 [Linnemannia schmuckeri]|uniref:Uncharacterized protein n=2 Tax=Linnemannia TaxID=2779861 RepID=A0A9P5RXR7_9FUNG|nr:hypothetical protein BG015_008265 [Linnemannia schmuckeri]
MNKSARKAVNLSVLQRHDPHISDILDSSSYVVVYKFDEDSQAWTKKGVEGTMFVFRRSTLPSYGFFIMNRLGIDNMMADLTADMALQLTSDYIIYRDEHDIHGIWVYEPADRDRIGEKLMECCKKAKDDGSHLTNGSTGKASPSASSDHSSVPRTHEQPSVPSAPTDVTATSDPLSRMLSEAMSRARVSESSGVPSTPQSAQRQLAEANSAHAHASTPIMSAQGIISSSRSRSSLSQQGSPNLRRDTTSPPAPSSSSSDKNEIPSFLLAIISQDNKDASSGSQSGSPHLRRESLKDPAIVESSSTQAMLLSSLTGSGKAINGDRPGSNSRSHGPPLSAEFLPASVMPSGLYSSSSNSNGRPNGANQGSPAPSGQPQRPSPPSGMPNPNLMNRPPNGMAVHGSPLQAPAFAYSPGMMPSPLAMPPMQVGPMMHPPPPHPAAMNGGGGGGPHLHHPPPPPLPFPPMGLPLPGQGASSSFPADAMHAAMGAVGFMHQQQRGFVNRGPSGEVMPKAEFTQQFMSLLQNDPQFMDVLYSNYTAVFARRG